MNETQDGIDHINVYSKGETLLGRMLSNFYLSPFKYPPYGEFKSVEGFWYYYFTGCKHDIFKSLYGWKAKEQGKLYRDGRKDITDEDKKVVLEAIRCKLRQNKKIQKELASSALPFKHYYVYGGKGGKKVHKPEYDWILDEFERIRGILKERE